MGYCYDMAGRLACDHCGACGDTRKRRCPFGWCQSPALCAKCWSTPDIRQRLRAYHATNCEHAAALLAVEQAARANPAPDAQPLPPPTRQEALF